MMPTPLTRRFRLILAGVDFSLESAHALRYAAATARQCGGRVVAVHAVDPLLSAAAAHAYAKYPIEQDARKELERFVRKTLGLADAGHVESAVVVGSARQALADEARRRHADVVVLGTHGRGGISKMFFGSTTEGLLRRYHGAVMVVPPRCGNPAADWPGGSIVAEVPPGPHHRAMLSAAARTAEVFGAWLTAAATEPSADRRPQASAPLIVLPIPDAARLETFTQGTHAYEFIRRARVPVLVTHTRRRIGHAERPKAVA
jgi:nucleotide-binding universal stress UspA family protein